MKRRQRSAVAAVRRAVVATLVALSTAATPTSAQVGTAPDRVVGRADGGRAMLGRAAAPAPLQAAIAGEARRHAAALSQTPPPSSSRGRSCGLRIAGFTALGAVAGLGAAAILLASTGGSDDTNGILTRWGTLGAAGGAVAGVVSCLAP